MCFWKNNKLQNIMIIDYIRRGGKILAENKGAILVEDKESQVMCLSAINKDCGKEVLTVKSSYEYLVLSQPLMLEYVQDKYNLTYARACYQGVYTSLTPLPLTGSLNISLANDAEIEIIMQTYQFADIDELNAARNRNMLFAAHSNGQFCGYIGEHGEGSMGMLHIFPQFRGKGYAAELESFLINKKLSDGAAPYCHIIDDNIASLNLQRKIGLDIAPEKIYWVSNGAD